MTADKKPRCQTNAVFRPMSWKLPDDDIKLPDELRGTTIMLLKDHLSVCVRHENKLKEIQEQYNEEMEILENDDEVYSPREVREILERVFGGEKNTNKEV